MRIIDSLKTKAAVPVAFICATLLALLASSPSACAEQDWSGFYFGAHVGGTSNNYDIKSFDEHVDVLAQFYQELNDGVFGEVEHGFSDFSLPRDDGSSNARPTGGFQAGYNMQFGHFVVGLESNVSFTSADETARGNGFAEKFFSGDGFNNLEGDTTLTTKRHAEMNWNASTELHLGYAWNQFLFYVLGGGAFAGVTVTTQDVASSDFFESGGDVVGGIAPQQGRFLGNVKNGLNNENSQVLTGYTAGGGVAMALTQLVSVNLEYRHSGYGEGNFNFQGNEFVVPGSTNVAVDTDQVLFKVNLLLGH
jgi:outer membrane immunogenic protein